MENLETSLTEPTRVTAADEATDAVVSTTVVTEATAPQGNSKITEIELAGVSVKVRTFATPAALKQIRDLVHSKFDEFSDKHIDQNKMAVLVAFNLAEELFKEQEKKRLLKRRVLETLGRLEERVEAHLKG